MRFITAERTLLFHEGVQLFEGRDETGRVCIGIALPDDGQGDRFLVAAVDADRLERFTGGDMDLRSLILDQSVRDWGTVTSDGGGLRDMPLRPSSGSIADFEHLPDAGYFLPELADEGDSSSMPAAPVHQATEFYKVMLRAGASPEKAYSETRRVFRSTEADVAQRNARAEIHRIYILRDPPIIADELVEWYSGPSPDDVYWQGLVTYLRQKRGWNDQAISDLDRASTQVLSRLAPPGMSAIHTRGLVVGYVQSGKTANFTAVLAKAADVDYRLFVVLSGLTNSLRNQTQERLEAELVSQNPGGWLPLTSEKNDFSRSYPTKADNVLNQGQRSRVLAVVKKNGTRLRRFIEWLSGAHPDTLRNCAMIIVDDEADQASINTSRNEAERSKINALLVRLLKLMPKAAYVGYTATPFANVLNEAPGPDSLYPRDFIVTLPRPQGYFGPEKIFGRERIRTEEEGADVDGLDMIRPITDDEAAALRESADGGAATVPESLDAALRYFLLATAARLVRRNEIDFSTLMVHTTQRVAGHRSMHDALQAHLSALRIRLDRDPSLLSELRAQWDEESARVRPADAGCSEIVITFDELLPRLSAILGAVELVIDNYVSPARLDFSRRGRVLVVIGGNTLARGLTVEGLVTSYFIRTSTAYDTLMQMGRWFGYRRGYEDLPRIWMTDELRDYFFDLATIEEEFRAEVRRYTLGLKPSQFGPRIRTHPALMITSRLKMQAAVDIDVSYGGMRCQTILFHHRDPVWLGRNAAAARSLLSDAAASTGQRPEPKAGRLRFTNVPVEAVFKFLEAYSFHPQTRELKRELLVRYIRAQNGEKSLEFWNVVVAGQEDAAVLGPWDTGFGEVGLINRARMKATGPDRNITANIKSLMSKVDIVADMDDVPDAAGRSHEDLLRIRRERLPRQGLIVLYPIGKQSTPRLAPAGRPVHRENLDALDTVVGAAFILPEPQRDTPQAWRTVDMSKAVRIEEPELPPEEADDAA